MKVYIVHYFDQHEHVRRATRLDCYSDDQAVTLAAQTPHTHAVEIWQGDRRVWRFEPLLAA